MAANALVAVGPGLVLGDLRVAFAFIATCEAVMLVVRSDCNESGATRQEP